MSRHATLYSPHLSRSRRIALVIVLAVSAVSVAHAQDAIRPSLAGEAAAEARRQSIDNIPYNLELGATKLRISATLGFEYNDNINLSEDGTAIIEGPSGPVQVTTHQQSDFIIRPQVNFDVL